VVDDREIQVALEKLCFPAAAATALGVAIMGFTRDAMIGVPTRVVVLSLAHHFLKPFLRKLM